MIELARHIEILLLENDCVIVPELGGFIAHYQPAYYAESDNIYFPPMRTIGFNPQLTMNDGLLVQSYMQVHHTDFPDATRMIEQEVEELKDTLYKDGHVQLYGIGDLHYTIHNSYEFRPNEEGILSPYLYGFSSLSISPLSENNSTIASTKDMVLKPQKEKAAITKDGSELPYAELYEKFPYLNITEWSVADVEGDTKQCGLSGSPTKVKKIENIVFQAKESKTMTGSDQDVEGLIVELLANHTIG